MFIQNNCIKLYTLKIDDFVENLNKNNLETTDDINEWFDKNLANANAKFVECPDDYDPFMEFSITLNGERYIVSRLMEHPTRYCKSSSPDQYSPHCNACGNSKVEIFDYPDDVIPCNKCYNYMDIVRTVQCCRCCCIYIYI